MNGTQSYDYSHCYSLGNGHGISGGSDHFYSFLENTWDLSRVKTERCDSPPSYEDSTFHRPWYSPERVKLEPPPYNMWDYTNSIHSHSYTSVERTLPDYPSSLQINRNEFLLQQQQQRSRKQSEMTEVLQPKIEGFSKVPATPGRKRSSGEGKRGSGRSGNTPYTTVPLPPCKVCGGVATGFHFGVITCEACKAFFRRALIHKQAYKCLKDDNCEIIDKKLGNCSACRLKKCFALGMSKGGVRRGRYSIAIRTKAIVEAKAMEGKDAEPMVSNKRPRLDDQRQLSPFSPTSSVTSSMTSPFSSSSSLSSDSGCATDDGFDGLLAISDLDEDMNMTVTVISKPSTMPAHPFSNHAHLAPPQPQPQLQRVQENSELEFLIDALISCQDAVYPKLKKHFEAYTEEYQYKVYEELVIKEEIFDEVFGKTDSLSTEEFQKVFAETGLDIDDRLLHFNKKGRSMEETIAQYVNFAKIIPGFKGLNPKDVSRLLKAAHMEFWMLGNYKLFSRQFGVCTAWDGSSGSTKETMSKFFDPEWIETTLDYAETLKKLNLSLVEMSLIRVIILTYTDRCQIMEREKVQVLQEKFVECLQYHLTKTVPNPGRRLAQIFDRLLAIRDLTELNTRVNRKFLTEWGFLMHDFPLWKEMLSFDEV